MLNKILKEAIKEIDLMISCDSNPKDVYEITDDGYTLKGILKLRKSINKEIK